MVTQKPSRLDCFFEWQEGAAEGEMVGFWAGKAAEEGLGSSWMKLQTL
jgi:hypothetical protein